MIEYDAVLFDLDDTLILENDFVKSAFIEVAQSIEEDIKVDRKVIYNDLLALYSQDVKRVFDRILEMYHCCSKDRVIKMVEIYKNHFPHLSMVFDVKPVLGKLKEIGVKLAIITDGDTRTQSNKLKAINAEQYFDTVIITDEYGIENRKPSEFPYRKCLEKLQLSDFRRTAYVGDNISKDFVTAKRLGMLTIQIVREDGLYKLSGYSPEYLADYQINDMAQILPLLGVIEEC